MTDKLEAPYNNFSPEELSQALDLIQAFRKSPAYQIFKAEHADAQKNFVEIVTTATPVNLGDLIAREQAIGSLGQLSIFLEWFDGQEVRLKEILTELKKTDA